MKSKLSYETILEIEKLFKEQKWEIDNNVQNFASLFNRFCNRLSLFDNTKQNLILELTHNFLKVSINDFFTYFLQAFRNIPVGLLQSAKRIFILPIADYSNTDIKSSQMLWYHLKNFCDFSYEKYFNKVSFIESPEKVKNKEKLDSYLFVFIDDYIGTGTTVDEFLKLINTQEFDGNKISNDKLVILSLVAQKDGISFIQKEHKVVCKTSIIRNKGISDNYEPDIARQNLGIMSEIEKELKIKEDYYFGFGASESLVSLEIKSPNNTFPVYWHETKSKIAPFPRYKIYRNEENN